MRLENCLHLACLVCGEIIQDDMDLLVRFAASDSLIEEVHELITCMAVRGVAEDLTGFDI